MSNSVARYPDQELEEFKVIIETKLEQATEQLTSLQEQIIEITENTSDEHGGDWVDDSSINNEVEMLNNMAIRQRRFIKDLENALVRIRNKSYGICVVTGELIDKKRLLAVPTTTKSLSAKAAETASRRPEDEPSSNRPIVMVGNDDDDDDDDKSSRRPSSTERSKEKKVITKIIRKPTSSAAKKPADDDDDDIEDLALLGADVLGPDVDDSMLEDDDDTESTSDFDDIADTSSDDMDDDGDDDY